MPTAIYGGVETTTQPLHIVVKPMTSQQIVATDEISDIELHCLAENIFWEARGESYEEKIRVANVTHNRVKHKHFPNSYCDVIYYPKAFSWTLDGALQLETTISKNKIEAQAWKDSYKVAYAQLLNKLPDLTNGAICYHSIKILRPSNFCNNVFISVASEAHLFYAPEKSS